MHRPHLVSGNRLPQTVRNSNTLRFCCRHPATTALVILGSRASERFAAIVPICGGGNPADAEKLKNLPIWVFHGAKDSVVPIARSEQMVEAIKAGGGNVEFTIYPEVDHNSWTEAYADPKLYEWLLKHKRNDK